MVMITKLMACCKELVSEPVCGRHATNVRGNIHLAFVSSLYAPTLKVEYSVPLSTQHYSAIQSQPNNYSR